MQKCHIMISCVIGMEYSSLFGLWTWSLIGKAQPHVSRIKIIIVLQNKDNGQKMYLLFTVLFLKRCYNESSVSSIPSAFFPCV
jgi:hypothetical protein